MEEPVSTRHSGETPLVLQRDNEDVTQKRIAVVPPSTRPAAPVRPEKDLPLAMSPASLSSQLAALRRRRVNRIVMRKRRHERSYREPASRLMVVAALFTLLLTCFSSSAGAAYAYYQAQLPLLKGIADHALFQSTRIFDRHGQLLYELYNHQDGFGRRSYVNYTDISTLLVKATIAAEDHSFWTNSGVDYQGIVRAAIANVQGHRVVEGGSTVTQQLVKNQLFPQQPRTLLIKGDEALLAYGLTQQYSKWKIMEMYVNTVYYGDLNYGAESAAQDYFNMQPQCTQKGCRPALAHLDLAQASLLAGMPRSPSYYNPVINRSAALERQKVVLQEMINLGMITLNQARQAEEEMSRFTFKAFTDLHPIQAPHFVRYVIDKVLVPLLGAQNLYNGGYTIYTTLDLNLEKQVEQITYNHLYTTGLGNYPGIYGPLDITNNVNNAAVVVMNPASGEILAMNGSADYSNTSPTVQGQYNAALALRQPGSSFKPVVYATAFEMGWYPAMIVPDHETIYPSQSSGQPAKYYSPHNYDGTFHSKYPMTIRTALANSFNIPAVDALEYAGIPNVLNMAGRLGLNEVAGRSSSELGPSLALGTSVLLRLM